MIKINRAETPTGKHASTHTHTHTHTHAHTPPCENAVLT